jgi:hypothetical protein
VNRRALQRHAILAPIAPEEPSEYVAALRMAAANLPMLMPAWLLGPAIEARALPALLDENLAGRLVVAARRTAHVVDLLVEALEAFDDADDDRRRALLGLYNASFPHRMGGYFLRN